MQLNFLLLSDSWELHAGAFEALQASIDRDVSRRFPSSQPLVFPSRAQEKDEISVSEKEAFWVEPIVTANAQIVLIDVGVATATVRRPWPLLQP